MEFRKADLGLLKDAPSLLDKIRRQREAERPHEVEIREREEQANVRFRAALMFGEMMVMEEREKRLRAEGRADALERLANGKLDAIEKRTAQTGRLVGEIASDKQRRVEQARRRLEEQREDGSLPPRNPETARLFKAIEKKVEELEKAGRKGALSQAVSLVAKRNGITENGRIKSLYEQFRRTRAKRKK